MMRAHLGFVGVAPVGFRLRFDPTGTTEDTDTAVQHLERAIHLNGEIDVSRSVDDVQTVVIQKVVVAAD